MSTDRPLGALLPDWTPPPPPPRTAMAGRYARVAPFDPEVHAADLYEANSADDAIWDYMPQGPFASFEAYRDWATANCMGDDPLFHAIVDLSDGKAKGVASYLRIAPAAGSIEVGYITYSPALQRTRANAFSGLANIAGALHQQQVLRLHDAG